jgi:hypothetical protein
MITFRNKFVNKIFGRRRDVYDSETEIKYRFFLKNGALYKNFIYLVIGVHLFLILLIQMSVYVTQHANVSKVCWKYGLMIVNMT